MRRLPQILVALFFIGAAGYFIQGLYRSIAMKDQSLEVPFQVGRGVGLVSVALVLFVLWGFWRSSPPPRSGSRD